MTLACGRCPVSDPRKRIENLEDLRKIMALKAVIESGSLRKAATMLKVTPSAVSQAIGGLERKFGKVMLIREATGMRPSAEGAQLVTKLGPALAMLDEVFDSSGPASDLKIGSLDIGVYESLAIGLLAPLSARLRRDFPKIKLSLLAARSAQVVKKIRSGELCFGIVTEQDGMEDLASEKIATDRLGVFVRADGELSRLSWPELQQHGIGILTTPAEGWPGYFARYLRSLGKEWKTAFQSDSLEVLLAAAQDGVSPVVLPVRVAARAPGLMEVSPPSKVKANGEHGVYVVSTLKCDRRELKYLCEILKAIPLERESRRA